MTFDDVLKQEEYLFDAGSDSAGSSAPACSPVLYRRLRWWERRQPGDEWLYWPTCEWVPAVNTVGLRTLTRTIRRPTPNIKDEVPK